MSRNLCITKSLSCALLLLTLRLTAQDAVVLANGQTIAGTIVKDTASELTIRVDGAEMVLKRNQLKSINSKPLDGGAGPASGAAKPAAPPATKVISNLPAIPPAKELAQLLSDYAEYLKAAPESRKDPPPGSAFTNLTKAETDAWRKALWVAWTNRMKEHASAPAPADAESAEDKRGHNSVPRNNGGTAGSSSKQTQTVTAGEFSMKFTWETVGQAPPHGWPLYIDMHGGGDNSALNDQQWKLEQMLHPITNGIHLWPRAPVDSIIGWDEPAFYQTLDELIPEFIALHGVDSNRIYLLGYSMGGWGAFHIGPTFADRWAAVEASAGGGMVQISPPENLRNTPFMIQIGALDNDYQRRPLAKAFSEALQKLHAADADGYTCVYKEHDGKGHQIDDSDAAKWLEKFVRNPIPEKLIWNEPDPLCGYGKVLGDKLARNNFGWLAVNKAIPGNKVTAERHLNEIHLTQATPQPVCIFLDDRMEDLEQAVVITANGKEVFHAKGVRSVPAMLHSLFLYGDPELMFSAEVWAGR